MSPVSILKVVVFPAPFEPSRPKHSLAFRARFNPFTASFFPYFFHTLLPTHERDKLLKNKNSRCRGHVNQSLRSCGEQEEFQKIRQRSNESSELPKSFKNNVTPSLIIDSFDDDIAIKIILGHTYGFGFDSAMTSFTTTEARGCRTV